MNQPQRTKHAPKSESVSKEPSKAPWHRPTVMFVPLHTTAVSAGSVTDGLDGSEKS